MEYKSDSLHGGAYEQSLNVAFVGCGGFSTEYWGVYRDLSWVKVVACIDPDNAVASRAALVMNERATISERFEDALREDVDVIVINTPNHLHCVQATSALRRGKNVLLQKPAAVSLAEALEIQAATRESDGVLGMYMSYLDHPLMHAIRHSVQSGELGTIVSADAVCAHRGGLRWSERHLVGEETWRSSKAQTGGGCLIQLGIHYVFLLEWMLGSHIARVQGISRNLLCPGLDGDDLVAVLLEFESGTVGTLGSSWSSTGELISLRGSGGHFFYTDLEWLSGSVKFKHWNRDCAEHWPSQCKPPSLDDVTNPYNQHRMFLEAIRDGQPPPVSLDVAVRNLAVIEAIYEAAATGGSVEVASVMARAARGRDMGVAK
jgi:predicted dehydrogenase